MVSRVIVVQDIPDPLNFGSLRFEKPSRKVGRQCCWIILLGGGSQQRIQSYRAHDCLAASLSSRRMNIDGPKGEYKVLLPIDRIHSHDAVADCNPVGWKILSKMVLDICRWGYPE